MVIVMLATFNVALAGEPKSTPVQKVIGMLTDLRAEILAEGKEEAETYDKYACFCKAVTEEKTTAISDGENQKNVLQAQINGAVSARDAADAAIAANTKALSTLQSEIEDLYKTRNGERIIYEKSEVDLTGAIEGLEAAILALKSAKTAVGFVQLGNFRNTLSMALRMAETLGFDRMAMSKQRRAMLVQLIHGEPVPQSTYEFHADNVISTLESLKQDFKDKKSDLQSKEAEAKGAFETVLADKQKAVENGQKEVLTSQETKATQTKLIEKANQDFTTTSAQLLDDQAYLSDSSSKCNEKALLWDQRTQMRSNELNALTQAIEVINTLPSQEDPSFLQRKHKQVGVKLHHVRMVLLDMSGNNRELERYHHNHHHNRTGLVGRRAQAVAFLRVKANALHRAWLLDVADKVAADPFAKVKVLIQELIERLLKEASEEADHKGWCDREIALAEQSRDQSADDIAALNDNLKLSEARRAKLSERIQELEKQLASLDEDLFNQTASRKKEKEENKAAIASATEGINITDKAIEILTQFYGQAAKASSFLQRGRMIMFRNASGSVEDDMPDAGFKGAYSGAQSTKGGIIGMLEVIKSDFERTVSETKKDEAIAAKDFMEFQTVAGASIATKGVSKQERENALSQANTEDKDMRQSMKSKQDIMDKALTELISLDKACRAGGTTAEERKAKRDEEMEALTKTLCIIEQHGSTGIDSC